jgi:hypothetical protein
MVIRKVIQGVIRYEATRNHYFRTALTAVTLPSVVTPNQPGHAPPP